MMRIVHNSFRIVVVIAIATMTWSCGTTKKSMVYEVVNQKNISEKPNDKPAEKKIKPSLGSPALQRALVEEARTWLGTPYIYGGHNKDGADCSGFIMEVYRRVAGVDIPRNSLAQREYCVPLDTNDLAVGDLVFFSSKASSGKIAHVGLYVGNGTMIHASSSKGVVESALSQNYYVEHYQGAGRLPQLATLEPVKRSLPEAEVKPSIVATEIVEALPVKAEQIIEPTIIKTPETPSASSVVKNAFSKANKP